MSKKRPLLCLDDPVFEEISINEHDTLSPRRHPLYSILEYIWFVGYIVHSETRPRHTILQPESMTATLI